MAEYLIQEETLVGIADAIRSKEGNSTSEIPVADMSERIMALETKDASAPIWGHVVVSAKGDAAFNIPLPFSGDVTTIIGAGNQSTSLLNDTTLFFSVNNDTIARYWNEDDDKRTKVTITRSSPTVLKVPSRSDATPNASKYNFAVCQDPEGTKII